MQTYQQVIEYLHEKKRTKHLLLGNGFSMAYDPGIFSYNALNRFIEEIKDDIVGQCWQNSEEAYIVIDMEYWLNASTMDREFIVFHELGHCYLQREHLDVRDARGICTSIMSSGTSNCVRSYTTQNRNDLLDELFLQ